MRTHSVTRRVDQASVDAYAEVSGDDNPLHVDPDFAAGTAFGSTIAHGLLILSWIGQAVQDALGDGTSIGSLDAVFVGPAPVGEQVHIFVDLQGDDGVGNFRCTTNDHDAVVGSFTGRAR